MITPRQYIFAGRKKKIRSSKIKAFKRDKKLIYYTFVNDMQFMMQFTVLFTMSSVFKKNFFEYSVNLRANCECKYAE